MSNNKLSLIFAVSLALGLTACGDDDATASAKATGAMDAPKVAQVAGAVSANNMGPAEVSMELAHLAKINDLKGMMTLAMPASEFKKIVDSWESKRKEPITDTQRKEFADGLAKLTAPGAIDELMKQAEPSLAQMKPQMAMYIPMGIGMIQQSIASNADMSDVQKKQATEMVGAMQGWATKTDFTDANRLRKALTEMANGVKATNITSLDQMQALSFDQVLGKGGVMFGSMKRALNAYDLNMDDMFSSLKAEQVSMTGDSALVKTNITFLGQQISSETQMVKSDGRWYSKDSIEAMKKVTESAMGENKTGNKGG
jgi:hypothetical protein